MTSWAKGNQVLVGTVVTVALLFAVATRASAEVRLDPNHRLIACYEEVTIPAEFYVTKKLLKEAERKYIRRNNRIELIENPAIYEEIRTLKSPRQNVLREISCD
ncbi:MAG: hypothetical protein AAFO93_10630 [Pseudomonadota bacterium]